ncbi:putative sulfate exporter family transporter [Leptospira sp. FAT2]|uniref:YeiH family protein n=1 Tax=Leptospira sanjuanensis TaxID=2879643 RepID=UPI001EE80310|nr:putative sulfate exporter family transporter [Leptospira sanjuanensis]MCG6194512.1 putative sulfate exporter family transporter [Leptospira sanjuanensis]
MFAIYDRIVSFFDEVYKTPNDRMRSGISAFGFVFGILLAAAIGWAANRLVLWTGNTTLSPLFVGMIGGIIVANCFGIKDSLLPGIGFASRGLLRFSVVLLGFRITLQELVGIGPLGYFTLTAIVIATFIFTYWISEKGFGLKPSVSFLIAAGCSICGASAISATANVVKSESHETAVAVGTVTILGMSFLLLEPILFQSGLLVGLDSDSFGFFVGTTIHEVAQAVAAGFALNENSGKIATIVKMGRVVLLAPLLLGLGLLFRLRKANGSDSDKGERKVNVPGFVWGFLATIVIHSLIPISNEVGTHIRSINDLFMLIALTAIGLDTKVLHLKKLGWKPVAAAGLASLFLLILGWIGAIFVFREM